ncbi:hypothetical protein R1sor_001007 [Riccia sorocarpa]|uniref:RING-type domain-containing protein n=1 Tax=Riccia sorocarpa TaxID=122646 RepID=A0ABD3GXW5_9MARC
MLPGVEVARRRRVRPGQGRYGAYDGGVRCSETYRSRFLATGLHHHQQPGTYPRLQPQLRIQDNLQEHQQRSEQAKATWDSPYQSNYKEKIDDDLKHQRWMEETGRSTFSSSVWKRQSTCSHSDPGDLAMYARTRLDKLLQVTGHMNTRGGNSSRKNSTACRISSSIRLLFHNNNQGDLKSQKSKSIGFYSWLMRVLLMKQCLSSPKYSKESILSRHVGVSIDDADARMMMNDLRRKGKSCWKEGDQDECPVCLEGLQADGMPITLPCRHSFHRHCLNPWLLEHGKCPCCRETIVHVLEMEKSTSSRGDGDLMTFVLADCIHGLWGES